MENSLLIDIPQYKSWRKIEKINYGWSDDIKFYDFNRWECGDRYEEFYKLQSCDVDLSTAFSIGQLFGYFDGEPPLDFWRIQAVYVAHSALFSIEWAARFGEKEIANMTRICQNAFRDYDNFNSANTQMVH